MTFEHPQTLLACLPAEVTALHRAPTQQESHRISARLTATLTSLTCPGKCGIWYKGHF